MSLRTILILGAYGNFGRHITDKLVQEADIQLILNGRNAQKCEALASIYQSAQHPPQVAVFDVRKELSSQLQRLKPAIVIHTCGPFQAQDYSIAEACIDNGCHYVDLADGRDFVANITTLNAKAEAKGVAIISGASSVPCLTAAVLDHYQASFKILTRVDAGIATAQRINVGLATIKGTLSYCGKPIKMLIDGRMQDVIGWQGMRRRRYPDLGLRYMSYCDIPDLALFAERYPNLQSYEFRVSLEVPVVQWMMAFLATMVRYKLIKHLPRWGEQLRTCAHWLDAFGSNDSGFHMQMQGVGNDDQAKELTFYLIAKDSYGPYIPSTPAILCAKKLARGEWTQPGAYPCLGIITLDEYLQALDNKRVTTIEK